MQFFLDSADWEEIAALAKSGLIDGVTTNPSLIARSGEKLVAVLEKICASVSGPVSAEVTATDRQEMVRQGEKLAAIAGNIVIKLPLTEAGLAASRVLRGKGHAVNVTLCFSAAQALLAAKAGASFVSPFIGRLDDAGERGMDVIRDMRRIFQNYRLETKILAASIRSVDHVREAALAGADCATLPPAVFRACFRHPLTDTGLAAFLADWKKTGQVI